MLVPREMPLSTIHLENMLALSRMGVAMVPPMPAFYNHPETVDDIVHHVVARVAGSIWPRTSSRQALARIAAGPEFFSGE
ncbi:4-hydroxybenzoate decarboxylase subunit B [Escherichia coli]|uniref:4-hydroxybenzoate decarboxylase subunit B n=1 Tax=Escherichia coli TaxID=562 RepID=A0A3S4LSM9_ECOLX|nr:4-hydroxybenzoate decarboxylase subunit B [Escherichia coli]